MGGRLRRVFDGQGGRGGGEEEEGGEEMEGGGANYGICVGI